MINSPFSPYTPRKDSEMDAMAINIMNTDSNS